MKYWNDRKQATETRTGKQDRYRKGRGQRRCWKDGKEGPEKDGWMRKVRTKKITN